MTLEQYERAIEDYDKAIELNPNFPAAYDSREVARSKLKEQNDVPGFEAIFAIVGLLAVAYFSRRKNKGARRK